MYVRLQLGPTRELSGGANAVRCSAAAHEIPAPIPLKPERKYAPRGPNRTRTHCHVGPMRAWDPPVRVGNLSPTRVYSDVLALVSPPPSSLSLRDTVLSLPPPLLTMRGLMRCASTGACRVAPGAVAARASAAAVGGGTTKVPAGHVPVEVGAEGEETERFVVPAELLGRPPIAELLRRAAQEYGYARRGPIRIPCPAAAFRRLLGALTGGSGEGGLALAYFSVVV